jgi:hypothetical protein
MKVQSIINPDQIWIRYIENGIAIVRIRRDITSSVKNNQTIFEYEEIEIEVIDRDNLNSHIIDNFDSFFNIELENAKQKKIDELNLSCRNAILSNFTSTCLGDSHEYGFDQEDQNNLGHRLGAINAGLCPSSFDCKTKDAGFLSHTIDQFKTLYVDGMTHKQTALYKCGNLKAQVLACTTIDSVNVINW